MLVAASASSPLIFESAMEVYVSEKIRTYVCMTMSSPVRVLVNVRVCVCMCACGYVLTEGVSRAATTERVTSLTKCLLLGGTSTRWGPLYRPADPRGPRTWLPAVPHHLPSPLSHSCLPPLPTPSLPAASTARRLARSLALALKGWTGASVDAVCT